MTSAAAVQTSPSTASETSVESDGRVAGRVASGKGRERQGAEASAPVTGPIGLSSARKRLTTIGLAA